MEEEGTPPHLSLEEKLFLVGGMGIIISGPLLNMSEVLLYSLWIGWLIFLLSLAWIR